MTYPVAIDGSWRIAPLLSLAAAGRALPSGACDDRASELDCNDDRSNRTLGSRIELDLEAGDYFIIMDSFRHTDEAQPGRRGDTEVNVTIR